MKGTQLLSKLVLTMHAARRNKQFKLNLCADSKLQDTLFRVNN